MSAPHLRHYVLSLTGSAQRLSSVLGAADQDAVLSSCWLQSGVANASPIYIGDKSLTVASYGMRVNAPVAGLPDPPLPLPGPIDLSQIWVLGANGETLHVGVLTS